MDWIWFLQKQMDKVQYNKHLNVYFGWFIFTSLKEDMLWSKIDLNLKTDNLT